MVNSTRCKHMPPTIVTFHAHPGRKFVHVAESCVAVGFIGLGFHFHVVAFGMAEERSDIL